MGTKNIYLFILILLISYSLTLLAQKQKPNILFIIGDDISLTSFSIYGKDNIPTPNVDRIGNEGIVFRNMYVTNPKCSPARSCILTGRYSWQLEEACNHAPYLADKWEFYPDHLEEVGYEIGFTGKGWAPGHHNHAHNPAGWSYNTEKLKSPHKGISSTNYSGNFKVFLDKKEEGKPFCFWLGTREAHRKYELDSWKEEGVNPNDMRLPAYYPDNDTIRGDLADYAVEVKWFDKHIGQCPGVVH